MTLDKALEKFNLLDDEERETFFKEIFFYLNDEAVKQAFEASSLVRTKSEQAKTIQGGNEMIVHKFRIYDERTNETLFMGNRSECEKFLFYIGEKDLPYAWLEDWEEEE